MPHAVCPLVSTNKDILSTNEDISRNTADKFIGTNLVFPIHTYYVQCTWLSEVELWDNSRYVHVHT